MEKETPLVTRDQITADLRALGVEPGQVILVHAAVKSIGWVVGGPDEVLRALLDVLTPAGTLAMYVSWEEWESALAHLPDCSEEQRAVFREHCPRLTRRPRVPCASGAF